MTAQILGVSEAEAALLLWPMSACLWGATYNYLESPRERTVFSLFMGMLGIYYCVGLAALMATLFPAIAVYFLAKHYRSHPRLGLLVTVGMLLYCTPL